MHTLMAYALPIEPTLATLASFGWDIEVPLVSLSTDAVAQVFERYLSGQLTSEQLTDWADLIECREDIFLPTEPVNLSEWIFRLGNPNLHGPVTPSLVAEMRDALRPEGLSG